MTLRCVSGVQWLLNIVVIAATVGLYSAWSYAADEVEQPAVPAELKAIDSATTPAERTRLAASLCQQLEKSQLEDQDLGLLVGLADVLERLRMEDASRDLYAKFARRLTESDDPGRKQLGSLMNGALRRLSCIGKPFALKGETCDGNKLDVAALRDKVVLVVYWATSQPESLQELLHVRRLQRDFQSRGLEVVGVSADGDRPTVERFMREIIMPWPTLHDAKAGPLQPAVVEYGISQFPTTFLVGRDGKVLAVNQRGRELRRKMIDLLGLPVARPVVSGNDEQASTIDDMADRFLDVGEQWIKEGKLNNGQQLLGDGLQATTTGKWAAPQRQPIGDEELYRRSLESVFVLGTIFRTPDNPEWRVFSATAFAVAADGVLSTSAHVFDFANWDVGGMIAIDSAGRSYPVEKLLALDAGGDTCLLQIKAQNLKPLPLAQRAPVGTRVRVVSHPGSSVYYMSDGIINSYEADEQGIPWMHISAQFGEGSSGAPVLDPNGNVVGQVSQTSTLFSTPQGEPKKPQAARRFIGVPSRNCAHLPGQAVGSAGEPQMVFRICTPAARMEKLFAK